MSRKINAQSVRAGDVIRTDYRHLVIMSDPITAGADVEFTARQVDNPWSDQFTIGASVKVERLSKAESAAILGAEELPTLEESSQEESSQDVTQEEPSQGESHGLSVAAVEGGSAYPLAVIRDGRIIGSIRQVLDPKAAHPLMFIGDESSCLLATGSTVGELLVSVANTLEGADAAVLQGAAHGSWEAWAAWMREADRRVQEWIAQGRGSFAYMEWREAVAKRDAAYEAFVQSQKEEPQEDSHHRGSGRAARYVGAALLATVGAVGLTVTEPVPGVGAQVAQAAPVQAKVQHKAVTDASVNVGGKRVRVLVNVRDGKVVKLQARASRAKLPKRLPVCESDYDMTGHKFGCRGIDSGSEYAMVPIKGTGLTAVVYGPGQIETITR
ncbi:MULTISPECIES: hypothetical protein [unclassified Luteococcus]|uniref:hypothetical protein n=1 Tax=unclassified Luteococcus TaxID=2639923 RepID=UPI00313DC299